MQRLRSVLSPVITAAGVLALSGIGLAQTPSESFRTAAARAHDILSSAPCPLARVTKEKITEDQARDLAQAFADKNWQGFKVVRPAGYGGGYTTMCYQTSQALGVQSAKVTTGTTKSERSDRDAADDGIDGKERERRKQQASGLPASIIGDRKSERSDGAAADDQIERERRQARASGVPAATDLRKVGAASARPLIIYSVEYSMDVKNPAGETRNLCVDQYGTVSEFCGDFAMAGGAGPMGPAGAIGAQGPAGATGAQGQLGSVGPQAQASQWSSFRDFLFDFDKSEIRANETKHVSEIAAYMKQNPAVQVGIDGHTDPRGTDAFNQGLSERRVNVISEALINAGVSAARIKAGAFGESRPKCNAPSESCWQSDRRVEVLIGNAQTASR